MNRTLFLIFSSFGLASTAMAEPGWIQPAGDPPLLKENATAEDIASWKSDYLERGAYVEAASDAGRVTLFDPGSLKVTGNGRITVVFRSELFRPRFADGHWLRSIRKTLDIDCTRLAYRELELHGFSGSNLKSPVPDIVPPDKWVGPYAPESSAGRGLAAACVAGAHAPEG